MANKNIQEATRSLLILDKGPNPSTDYFVRPFAEQHYAHILQAHEGEDPSKELINPPSNIDVIIVRSISRRWLRFIQQHRSQLGQIMFFFDDDIFSPSAWRGLPIGYVWRLAIHALKFHFGLKPLIDHYFVGSEALRSRYHYLNPQVLKPLPVEPNTSTSPIILFYHASASHFAEKAWLVTVVREILKMHPNVHFEIIGGQETKTLYRHLPRVSVVHQMDWISYQSFCKTHKRHIGLAPKLNNKFNSTRSETKIFDIERCGAIGIISNTEPFSSRLKEHKNAVLVENDPKKWIEAINSQLHELMSSKMNQNS